MPRRCRSGLKLSAATMRAAERPEEEPGNRFSAARCGPRRAPACERGRPEEEPGKSFSGPGPARRRGVGLRRPVGAVTLAVVDGDPGAEAAGRSTCTGGWARSRNAWDWKASGPEMA